MPPKSVLVIGANRRIGLRLLQEFVSLGWSATGTIRPQTRNDPSVDDLKATGAKILELDYASELSIKGAATEFGSGPLDCLVNCGGLSPQPFPWDAHDGAAVLEMLNVMAVGPYLAIKHFMPNLKQSSMAKIAQISSEFGCITRNNRGGYLGYRMAKAALNQQNKTIAQSFKEGPHLMVFLALEPGYVPTRLTGWKGEDGLDESVRGMINKIETAGLTDSGLMFDYHGKKLEFNRARDLVFLKGQKGQ